MIVTIPYAEGIVLNGHVIASLVDQTVHNEFYFEKAGLPFAEVSGNDDARYTNICKSRNQCLEVMNLGLSRSNETCVAMNDNDCQSLYRDNLSCAETFLIEHTDFAVVALTWETNIHPLRLEIKHVVQGLWVYHKRFFGLGLYFDHEPGGCECQFMCDAIRSKGLRIGYLDSKKRLERLKGK